MSVHKPIILIIITILMLVISLVHPSVAFADDNVPPDGAAETREEPVDESVLPEESAESTSDGSVDESAIPSENLESDRFVEGNIFPADESEDAEVPEKDDAGEVGEGDDSLPDEDVPEIESEKTPVPSVVETIEAMNEAGVMLADENGDPIPLATEAAQNALLFPDPIGCPPGVRPATWGGTGVGCTASYASIQAAIDDVSVAADWTIYIDPGTFVENIVVDKSVTLQGSGMGVTIIQPAISGPACAAGSICPGSSNIILVQADNVTIRDLTVDGNNPNLNSGVFSNGVDVDARNGIITDHTNGALGVIDGLEVDGVEVKNIYLRGIYASDSGTFYIHDNVVDNVNGEYGSIAIFNFGGSGTIANNVVSNANDGIAANWSTGTQFFNNTITNTGTGIHTDNTQASDVISDNTIYNGSSNSYGIFVFAPYAPVSVMGNAITDVDVGLTVSGNGWGDSLNTITFEDNEVTTNVIGAYVTTDVWYYFFSDVSAEFNNNIFTGGDYGFFLESNGTGEYYTPGNYDCSGIGGDCVLNVKGSGNSITGQNLFAATIAAGQLNWYSNTPAYYGEYNVDLRGNWWGDISGPKDATVVPDDCGITLDNPSGLGGDVSECILYGLWLAEKPFTSLPPVGGDDPDYEEVDYMILPPNSLLFSIFGFGIPVTGAGENIIIGCDSETSTFSVGTMSVTFAGLCGYQVVLDLLTLDTLPASLGDGWTFLYGLAISLFDENGKSVTVLPADTSVVISFPGTGIPMKWTPSGSSPWMELKGGEVGGFLEVSAGQGTFILTGK